MILRRVYHPRTLTSLRHSSPRPSILVCSYSSKKSSPSTSTPPSSSSSSPSSPSPSSSSKSSSFNGSSTPSPYSPPSSTSDTSAPDNISNSTSPPSSSPSQTEFTVNTEQYYSPSSIPPHPTEHNFDPNTQFPPDLPYQSFLDNNNNNNIPPDFYQPLYNHFSNNFNENPFLPFPPFPPDFSTAQFPNPWLYPHSIPPPPPDVLQTQFSLPNPTSPPPSESLSLAFAFINAGSKTKLNSSPTPTPTPPSTPENTDTTHFTSTTTSEDNSTPSISTPEDVNPIEQDELLTTTLKLSLNGSTKTQKQETHEENSNTPQSAHRTVAKSTELPPKLPAKYAILLQRLCKQNDIEGCDRLLNTIAGKGVQLDVDTTSMLISHACSLPNAPRALSFLSSMRANGLHPSTRTSLSLLYLFVDTNDFSAALEHLQTMREHYARLNEGDLCEFMIKAKEKWAPSQCVDLLKEAIRGGMEPYKSFRLLIEHSIAHKDWAVANELVTLVFSPALTIKAPQLFFSQLLCAYAQQGNMEQVMSLLEKIHSHKLILDGKYYAEVMAAVQPPADFPSLSLLYKDMVNHNIRPFKGIFPLIIQAASENRRNYEVVEYYTKYLELGAGPLPPMLRLEVVKSLAFANEGEKCWQLIRENQDLLLKSSKTLTTAFNFFKKNDNALMCSRIFSILAKTPLPTKVNLLDAGLPILIDLVKKGNKEWKKELDNTLAAHDNLLSSLSPDTTKQIEAYLKENHQGKNVQSVTVSKT